MDTLFSRNLHNSAHKTYIFGCYYIGTAKDNTLCWKINGLQGLSKKLKHFFFSNPQKTSAALPLKQVSIFIGLHLLHKVNDDELRDEKRDDKRGVSFFIYCIPEARENR